MNRSQQTVVGISQATDRFPISTAGFIQVVTIMGAIFLTAACLLAQGLEGPPPPDMSSLEPQPLPSPSGQDAAQAVIARVNGVPIFQNQVERAMDEVAHNQKIGADMLPTVEATMLQKLIDHTLVQQFLTAEKMTPSVDEITATVERLRTALQQQNSNLEDFLARTHQTEASLHATMEYELGWRKFVDQQTTDKSLQTLFDRFHEQFDGTQRRVSHILLRPEGAVDSEVTKALVEQAQKLRDDIEAGKLTFEDAAQKYSAGPSRSRGGDLGFIPLKGVMAGSFSQAAFSIKPGEISTPVVTNFGVHLIKVTDVKPGTKTWQEVRDQLQPALSEYLLAAVTKQMREKSLVEYAAGVPHFKKGTTELEISQSPPGS
ncbi:MAG TPA: peptidylprolyl isomerase [Pirellulales bacterium]|nr:peptidylprolyl isomerase [Pirellulales bacterium]